MGKLIKLLLVLVIVGAIAGYFLEWYSIGKEESDDGEAKYSITFDKEKVKEDAEKAKDAAEKLRSKAEEDK